MRAEALPPLPAPDQRQARAAFKAYVVAGHFNSHGRPKSYPHISDDLDLRGFDATHIRMWCESDFPWLHRRIITFNPPGGFPAPADKESA